MWLLALVHLLQKTKVLILRIHTLIRARKATKLRNLCSVNHLHSEQLIQSLNDIRQINLHILRAHVSTEWKLARSLKHVQLVGIVSHVIWELPWKRVETRHITEQTHLLHP